MRVIGLTGKARAGKDTVASMIAAEINERPAPPGGYAPQCSRQGFADKLKLSAARALGYDGGNPVTLMDRLKTTGFVEVRFPTVEGVTDEVRSISGREYLQRYGTEAHRDVFGRDFWLDAVLPEGRDDCEVLVIPDVRFENEAERVRDHAGEVWEVRRPGADIVADVVTAGHSSEGGVPDALVDIVIENTGTLDELREKVRAAL